MLQRANTRGAPRSRWGRLRLLLVLGTLVLAAGLLWWGWVSQTGGSSACMVGEHAAWIGVEWTSQPVNDAEVRAFAAQVRAARLRWLFPFTTYLKPDGSWSPSYQHAGDFVAAYQRADSDARLLAWVGLPTPSADFADQQMRSTLIAGIVDIVTDAGFDGVHLNAEPLPSGDPDFLAFLDELRVALPEERSISVAGLPWATPVETALSPANPFRWSGAYYREVATRVDQLAVMAYDSHMPDPALYRLWMREQVHGVSASVAGSGVELLFGVSLSREVTPSHNPAVESLVDGLSGICAGLSFDEQREQTTPGVALYALWEATEADWQLWQDAMTGGGR